MNRITVLGSFHGHNAGDDAIIASIISMFKERNPDIIFDVLSGRPWLLKKVVEANIISTRPLNLSLNMLGFPAVHSIYRSDMTIVTQAIIFDLKLWNPAYNNLIALSLLLPFAKLCKKPVIGYNIGVGPLNTRIGKWLGRKILNNIDLIILRQEDSADLIKEIGVHNPKISLGADPALMNTPISDTEAEEIIKSLGIGRSRLIGVNVHGSIDKFISTAQNRISEESFVKMMSSYCDNIIEILDVSIIFIVTVSSYDEEITLKIRNSMKHIQKTGIVSNKKFTHNQIMGVLGHLDLFVGTRLHSIILAAAMNTPVIGIEYLPKVKDFMKRIQQDEFLIAFSDLTEKKLIKYTEKIWEHKTDVKSVIQKNVNDMKKMVDTSTDTTLSYLS